MKFGRAALVAALLAGSVWCNSQVSEASIYVNENIFQWVQSSSRMGYYFNQQQICFRTVDGEVDINTLIVPVLKVYDSVQINDTISKRRWHMKSLWGFDDLVGNSEYVEVDIPNRIVSVKQTDYVDSTWSTIETSHPNVTFKLDELSDKSLDKIFFTAVIDYAMQHQLELALRTRSDISDTLRSELEQKQQMYLDAHDPAIDELVQKELQRLAVDEPIKPDKKKKKKNR